MDRRRGGGVESTTSTRGRACWDQEAATAAGIVGKGRPRQNVDRTSVVATTTTGLIAVATATGAFCVVGTFRQSVITTSTTGSILFVLGAATVCFVRVLRGGTVVISGAWQCIILARRWRAAVVFHWPPAQGIEQPTDRTAGQSILRSTLLFLLHVHPVAARIRTPTPTDRRRCLGLLPRCGGSSRWSRAHGGRRRCCREGGRAGAGEG